MILKQINTLVGIISCADQFPLMAAQAEQAVALWEQYAAGAITREELGQKITLLQLSPVESQDARMMEGFISTLENLRSQQLTDFVYDPNIEVDPETGGVSHQSDQL